MAAGQKYELSQCSQLHLGNLPLRKTLLLQQQFLQQLADTHSFRCLAKAVDTLVIILPMPKVSATTTSMVPVALDRNATITCKKQNTNKFREQLSAFIGDRKYY